jgi:hypothetical protein
VAVIAEIVDVTQDAAFLRPGWRKKFEVMASKRAFVVLEDRAAILRKLDEQGKAANVRRLMASVIHKMYKGCLEEE